jgi:hypothetical protein
MRPPLCLVLSLLLGLTVEVAGQATSPPRPNRLPKTYLLRGVVRDQSTGAPVADARIWPLHKGWGAVSDEQGRYELRWRGRAVWTFLVRLCEDRNVARFQVDFDEDSVPQRDLMVPASGHFSCPDSDRVPWAVDARDTASFVGHYIYSWEGGGWLETCDGATYSPDWDSVLGKQLRRRQQREGQRSFVRFRGRVAADRMEDDLAPGLVYVNFPGPLYLVNTVDEVRDARPGDCS